MDIVCFGQRNWADGRVTRHHLLSRAARDGHRVLHVDPQPDAAAAGLREVEPGVHVLTRAKPIGSRAGLWLWRLRVGLAVRRLRFSRPVAFVLIPLYRFSRLGFRTGPRVYFAEDEWTAFGGLTDGERERFRWFEERLLRESDLAFAVSPRLVSRFRRIQPLTFLLENGVDLDRFGPDGLARAEPHPAVAKRPRPRIVFVGQVDERVDPALVARLARARPEASVLLVGRVTERFDRGPLAGLGNVHTTGWVQWEELPGVLREADVLVVPYRRTALTESCNPLKVYEYLATGKPVVTTPLGGLNAARGAVAVAADADAFVAAVDAALADPERGRAERLAVAAGCDWEARAAYLLGHLDRVRAGHPPSLDAREEADRRLSPVRTLSLPRRIAGALLAAAGAVYGGLRRIDAAAAGERGGEPRRILLARNRAFLGDLVLLAPALAALRRRFPRARLDLAVGPGSPTARLLRDAGLVDRVVGLRAPDTDSRRVRIREASRLFLAGYDALLEGPGYSCLPTALHSGAPARIGFADGRPEAPLLSRRLPLAAGDHESELSLRQVAALGADPDPGPGPFLDLPTDERRRAEALLRQKGLFPLAGDVLLLHPGSKRPTRRWPAERFGALAAAWLAAASDRKVVISGGPGETELAGSVREAVPPGLRDRVLVAAGESDLAGLVVLLDASRAVVSNDTGVLHLARERGRPLLALLGPENDRRWGPRPGGPAPVVSIRHIVPCAPCDRFECALHSCMRRLTVAEAVKGLEDLLARPPDDGAVDRRAVRHSFPELAGEGSDLPAAGILLLAHPERLAEAVEGALDQDYPATRLALLVAAPRVPPPPGPDDRVRVVAYRPGLPRVPWEAGLAALGPCAAVALRRHGDSWPRSRVGDDVGALLRSPAAAGAFRGRVCRRERIDRLPWPDLFRYSLRPPVLAGVLSRT